MTRTKGEGSMATAQRNTQPMASRAKSARPAAPKAAKEVTKEMVAARAYEIWQERGCPEGSEQENWYQAEQELLTSPHDE